MKYPAFFASLCLVLLISACGGGGGSKSSSSGNSEPRLTLTQSAIDIYGTKGGMNTVPSAEITGRVTGMDSNAYVLVEYRDNGIISFADLYVEGTSGILQIEMIDPYILDANHYVDSIKVSVCEDSACTRHIQNSPQEITVNYLVTENPALWGKQLPYEMIDKQFDFDISSQVDDWEFTSSYNNAGTSISHNATEGALELDPETWGGDNFLEIELAEHNIDFRGGTVRGEIHLDSRYTDSEELSFSVYFEYDGEQGSSWPNDEQFEYGSFRSFEDSIDGVVHFSATLPLTHAEDRGIRRIGLRILGDELQSGASLHPIRLDNVEIGTLLGSQLGETANYNGDFEVEAPRIIEPLVDALTSWSMEQQYNAMANFAIVDAGANGTSRSMAIEVVSTDRAEAGYWEVQALQDYVPVQTDIGYVYSMWIKSSEPARARIEAGEIPELGYRPIVFREVYTTTEWQQVLLSFRYNGGNQVRLSTAFSYTGNDGVTFYIDEVELRPIETAQ